MSQRRQPVGAPVVPDECRDPQCLFHKRSTEDELAHVTSVWRAKKHRVNVVTGDALLPCSTQLVTRQRMRFEVIGEDVVGEVGQLRNAVEAINDMLPRVLTPIRCDTSNYTAADNDLGEDADRDAVTNIMPERRAWLQFKKEAVDGTLQHHYTRLREFLEFASSALESIEYLNERMQLVKTVETTLTQCMYPTKVEDIYAVLRLYAVVPQGEQSNAITVSSLGSLDDETCALCLDHDIEKLFVRLLPSCTDHVACVEARHGKIACTCNNKFMHLCCLAEVMLTQYNEHRGRGGGGTASLTCPLCRGIFCYNDLVPVRVKRTVAESSTVESVSVPASPSKKRAFAFEVSSLVDD